jgi:hypothetical protein
MAEKHRTNMPHYCKKCGKKFYAAVGSNCGKSRLCPRCIEKAQDKTGKFWQEEK